MSLSSEGIAIVLYGASKEEFTEQDWDMAYQIASVLGLQAHLYSQSEQIENT